MLEIRGHARGGQGMVTAFEILAKIFNKLGDFHVQSFPAFGVERTGAPIQAFLRVAKDEILNRSNIYNPNLVVVFDETLINMVPVFDGLQENGSALLNTEKPISEYLGQCSSVYTIPALQISIDKGLGSKSLPIVNAAMIGAIMRILEGDPEIAKMIVSKEVPNNPEANAESMLLAYQGVLGLENKNESLIESFQQTDTDIIHFNIEEILAAENGKPIEDLSSPSWVQPMSINKTGNWRVLTPTYITKTPPCTSNCPAGTDVREFVNLATKEKFDEAFDKIYSRNPFPSICGRVCPHFCEQNCNRKEVDDGLNIGAIERFLGDRQFDRKIEKVPLTRKEKIAVIGAGPAGLTTALRLVENGYDTTVFEALPYAGGMMRTGIPEFRLPKNVLDSEISSIEKRGVKIVLNKKVTIDELSGDFSAIVAAVGSHIESTMRIENEDLVIEGISFLRKFKLENDNAGIAKGEEIAIIGGGNTAIDVSRTSLRLGASPTIYYRRTHNEMPAIAHEVEEAIEEGVKFKFLTAPTALNKGSNGKIEMEVIEMELGEPDDSGRRRPVPKKGSEQIIKVDKVVTAIGQWYDEYVFNGNEVKPKQGRIEYTTKTPVFCAGDMAWGGTVTEAIGSGNKAAAEIDALLQGMPYNHKETLPEVVLPTDINFAYYLPSPRFEGKVHQPKDLYNNFAEVVEGLTEIDILSEGARCLHCGECFSCGNCYNYCPDAAVHIDDTGRIRIDYDYCKGCGICVNECPSSAMNFNFSEVPNEQQYH
jgi:2-oxoacid:acceptor oxidoreductase gamma subunit (pyruvate/2-ketoisovalerate family)/2-oxoacid:acceptor oxidoreductase delta subunit (pyruvate/2-ketoisovalerate family)